MKVVAELSRYIKDELSGVKEYAKMAMEYKTEYPELAEMFYNMANNENTHVKNIHTWLVKFVDKTKKEGMRPIPQGMLDVWAWEHRRMIEELNEAEMVLQNYKKI